MITTESKRQLALLGMISDYMCDSLAYFGYEPGVLELSDGRVVLSGDCFELMLSVELHVPAKLR